MTKLTRAALVAAYWHQYVTQYVVGDSAEGDRWFWAWEAVDEAVRGDGEGALDLLVDLAEACHSSAALAYLGAGPVEDLVQAADAVLLERFIGAAKGSGRFRRALATIWIDDPTKVKRLRTLFLQYPPEIPDGVFDDATGP